jgi:hypothetical protein
MLSRANEACVSHAIPILIGFVDQLLYQLFVILRVGTSRIDIDNLQHLRTLGDKLEQRFRGGDIVNIIFTLDGIFCDYLSVSNLYLWYYARRPAPFE